MWTKGRQFFINLQGFRIEFVRKAFYVPQNLKRIK